MDTPGKTLWMDSWEHAGKLSVSCRPVQLLRLAPAGPGGALPCTPRSEGCASFPRHPALSPLAPQPPGVPMVPGLLQWCDVDLLACCVHLESPRQELLSYFVATTRPTVKLCER